MNDIAIRVENLGKKYTLGGQKSGSFRESITNLFSRNGKETKNHNTSHSNTKNEFWALKDINFEIKRGEAVGIIGRNGAGKSTLLKVLSRITEPTKGRFEVFGRVSSLLEVGTGFHPELTGRENVYLNGTILGMKRAEVKAKFDEIVAFSGVEKFIDTPVKHYSSGMQVRLAFAVAAHLEPEILIIDEVLAVGDAEFQKKCLGKMEDVTGEGRTVLFVSHNMGAVKRLCSKGIYLKKGKVDFSGTITATISEYISNSFQETKEKLNNFENIDQEFYLENARLLQKNIPVEIVQSDLPVTIEIRYRLTQKINGLRLFFDLLDSEGNILVRSLIDEGHLGGIIKEPGNYMCTATIPANVLVSDQYIVSVQSGVIGTKKFHPEDGYKVKFHVQESGNYFRGQFSSNYRGKMTLPVAWSHDKEKEIT